MGGDERGVSQKILTDPWRRFVWEMVCSRTNWNHIGVCKTFHWVVNVVRWGDRLNRFGGFLGRTEPHIKIELRMWAMHELHGAIELDQQIKEKNQALKQSGFGSLVTWFPNNSTSTMLCQFGGNLKSYTYGTWSRTGAMTHQYHNLKDRRLTKAHTNDKRDRGLWYRCDDKWINGTSVKPNWAWYWWIKTKIQGVNQRMTKHVRFRPYWIW